MKMAFRNSGEWLQVLISPQQFTGARMQHFLVSSAKTRHAARRPFEIQKMVKRLGFLGAALEKTIHALNELTAIQAIARSHGPRLPPQSHVQVKEISFGIVEQAY